MKKLFILLVAAGLMGGCKKVELAGNAPTGEGLVPFSLKSPSSGTNVVLNAATPNATVDFSWNPSKPGLHTAPTYKWVAAPKTTGNLDNPLISFPSGNNGSAASLSLTYKQLDSLLKAAGIADGAKIDLAWSIQADNGSTKILAQNSFNISVTRFRDGAAPFSILGPATSAAVMSINPGSTTDSLKFNWTRSVPAAGTTGLKYRVNFYNEATSAVLFSMSSNHSGADTLLTVSYKDFSDSLTAHGLTDPSSVAKLTWNVSAISGSWNQMSDYTNQLYIARLVRMYLVGSINGWDINTPLEMVADKAGSRLGKVFYTYIYLTASDEFKFARTPGDWGSAYGDAGATGTGYATGVNQGNNFKVPAAGVYRLTIDLGNNVAFVQQKQVGLVGDLQGWDPSSPVYGGLVARNKFLIIGDMGGANKGFKFHDGPAWDNSSPDKARWWGKGTGNGNLDVDGNGDNLTASGRVRAIWDATDPQQVKYDIMPATEMRVVGDGIKNVAAWTPAASPQMTYIGNGKWQITIDLVGGKEIKFLAGNDWGAFDYEDNSGGSNGTGTARAIKWDGGPNFKTPAADGTYTITLDEHNQTVTIN